jgi:tetratricopeptide (TPR) repeat protein
MPESTRVLRFPGRFRPVALEPAVADAKADAYLAAPLGERSDELARSALCEPDVLFAVCGRLRGQLNVNPSTVALEAATAHELIRSLGAVGLFDERDYLLGETALLAGVANRHLGCRAEAFRWLDRSEASFRHTVNPAPGLANVAYARLSLRFEMTEYGDVIELTPSLRRSFNRLGMGSEEAKCRLLEAAALKNCGREQEAFEVLRPATDLVIGSREPELLARILTEVGDLYQVRGDFENAVDQFRQASKLLEGAELCLASADLKLCAGVAYWGLGNLQIALGLLRSAAADYAELKVVGRAAYARVLAADILLKLDRPREAEWEILQALPTIEEQKMVPEGFAAVALLRESVKRRKADPNALRELREHLQKQN